MDLEVLIPVAPEIVSALQWWLVRSNLSVGLPFSYPPPVTIMTDASLWVWEATLRDWEVKGPWSWEESRHSSNWQELMAIWMALQAFAHHLEGCYILVRTDIQVTRCYLNHQGGTRCLGLDLIAREIFSRAESHLLLLGAVYIPGVNNVRADSLSRNFPSSVSYHLSAQEFRRVRSRLGTLWLDLFASRSNRMLPLFCAEVWSP